MPFPIDPDVIHALRALDPGPEGTFTEMVALFLVDAQERLSDLRAALAAGDGARIADLAHALKGACSNFGAAELQRRCEELEARAQRGDLGGATAALRAVQEEAARVQAALRAECRARGSRR